MTPFSFRSLATAWAGLAGAVAVGAGALQASYVVPETTLVASANPPAEAAPARPSPVTASVPFENRSLLAMLPPPAPHPHLASHAAAPVVAPLPVPPVPPMRVARLDRPRRMVPRAVPDPVYVREQPPSPAWAWGGRLPFPGQYVSGRAYYYGGPGYYGW